MKLFFKSFNIFIALLLFIAAIGVALLAFPVFGNKALIVRSGSMTPTIDIGSVVVVRDFGVSKAGDVIAFRSEKNKETIITHRVVEVLNERGVVSYKTQGDANEEVDGWTVRQSQVIGKTFLVVPYVGKALMFARTATGLASLIVVPALFVIFLEIISIIREVRRKRRITQNIQIQNINIPKRRNASVVVMLSIGIILVIGGVISSTFAFQSDTETSTNNVFQAAASFGTPTPTITPTPTTPPIAQTLVMNELLPLSTQNQGQDNCQFLELWNGSGATVSLQNFKLTDGVIATPIAVVNSNTLLPNGQFAVLVKSNGLIQQCDALESLPNGTVTANFGGQIDLNTGTLQLLDSNNVVIDTIKWGTNPNPLPTVNQSIERDPTGLDSALGTNFEPSDFVVRPTPRPGE